MHFRFCLVLFFFGVQGVTTFSPGNYHGPEKPPVCATRQKDYFGHGVIGNAACLVGGMLVYLVLFWFCFGFFGVQGCRHV